MTVLIVEDEPAIADNIAYALRTEGFATHCVGLGRDALAALNEGAARGNWNSWCSTWACPT